jgi:NAD(P)-dependent dehydrogenase (short-subunit alcohol dehydrogenase family)
MALQPMLSAEPRAQSSEAEVRSSSTLASATVFEHRRCLRGLMVVVGSQAGKDGFKAEMEAKEGPGAVDNEKHYIDSMRRVRMWAETVAEREKERITVHLVQPALVDTALVRREFRAFGIDWTAVEKPEAYARRILTPLLGGVCGKVEGTGALSATSTIDGDRNWETGVSGGRMPSGRPLNSLTCDGTSDDLLTLPGAGV